MGLRPDGPRPLELRLDSVPRGPHWQPPCSIHSPKRRQVAKALKLAWAQTLKEIKGLAIALRLRI